MVNVPSTPIGWTAGKWGEWYADMERDGKPTVAIPKAFWQGGWRSQHDRLVQAASRMPGRIPLFVSGDLHAIGHGRMLASGGIDLSANPVTSILTGPLETGLGWPSARRGMLPQVPNGIKFEESLPALEQNGFILADFTPERITVRFFKWDRKTQTVADMDTLNPFRTVELQRPARFLASLWNAVIGMLLLWVDLSRSQATKTNGRFLPQRKIGCAALGYCL